MAKRRKNLEERTFKARHKLRQMTGWKDWAVLGGLGVLFAILNKRGAPTGG